MAHTSKRFVFFDAFAGPGVYSDGSPGSPLIALETLLSHAVVNLDCEFILLFNEGDVARYEHLVDLLDQHAVTNPLPSNVKVLKSNQKFIELGDEISKYFGDAQSGLAPTLVFVDPFGVSEAPLATLQRILSFPKCEVFAYLGVNTINRFGTAGNIDDNMEALFGTTDFRNAPPAGNPDRISYFVELYKSQLKANCDFKYALSFQMRNTFGIVIYFLVYATNSIRGLSIMKDAMWKVAPDGSYSFSARFSDQDVLFQFAVDYESLASTIGERFRGRSVPFSSVDEFVLVSTPYRSGDVRSSLKVLENQGKISVHRNSVPTPRRRGTYPKDSTITFSE